MNKHIDKINRFAINERDVHGQNLKRIPIFTEGKLQELCAYL